MRQKFAAAESGFSLVQLMVAIGVLSIVMMFTFVAPNIVFRSQRTFNTVKDFSDIKSRIRNVLKNPEQCRCNFKYISGHPIRDAYKFPARPSGNETINIRRVLLYSDLETCADSAGDIPVATDNPADNKGLVKINNVYMGRIMQIGNTNIYRSMLYVRGESGTPAQSRIAAFTLVLKTTIAGNVAYVDSCVDPKDELYL